MTTIGPSGYEGADATVSAQRAVAAVLNDSTVFELTRAIYVGTGGTVIATMADGVDATFTGVNGGTVLPIQCKKLKATGASASNIVRLY